MDSLTGKTYTSKYIENKWIILWQVLSPLPVPPLARALTSVWWRNEGPETVSGQSIPTSEAEAAESILGDGRATAKEGCSWYLVNIE